MEVQISSAEEYEYCVKRNFEPLVDKRFILDIDLRVQIQYNLFCGSSNRVNIPQANERFYHFVWNNKPHYCENCFKPLYEYSATFISHILTKGGFAEISLDPRNTNILCGKCHNIWEFGKLIEKKKMLIFIGNMNIIQQLKSEYNGLQARRENKT